jgi:hypothetical protein
MRSIIVPLELTVRLLADAWAVEMRVPELELIFRKRAASTIYAFCA